MGPSQPDQPPVETPRLGFRKNWISYVVLVLAFGVVVPRLKGLEFFDPQLISAYACLGMIFAGPAAARPSGKSPAPRRKPPDGSSGPCSLAKSSPRQC